MDRGNYHKTQEDSGIRREERPTLVKRIIKRELIFLSKGQCDMDSEERVVELPTHDGYRQPCQEG